MRAVTMGRFPWAALATLALATGCVGAGDWLTRDSETGKRA